MSAKLIALDGLTRQVSSVKPVPQLKQLIACPLDTLLEVPGMWQSDEVS